MIVQSGLSQAVPTASSVPVSSPVPAAPARTPSVDAISSSSEETQPKVSDESISKAVSELNSSLRRSGSALQFTIDRNTDTAIVSLVDAETGTVIRQIPSEEALAIARSIDEMLQRTGASCTSGILCSQTA